MTRYKHRLTLLLLSLIMAVPVSGTAAVVKRSMCVFDPVGAQGFVVQQFQDYRVQAREWGVDLEIKAYNDERVVASDFKTGHCDAMGVTGIRARKFVKFSGSLDMAGALQTYDQLHTAIQVMSSPKAADLMREGEYEVAGVVPGGKVYLFSSDKNYLDSLEAAAGKKVAVMSFDRQGSVIAKVAGASPVPATIASFGPMFNNHSVDMAYAPAFAYNALELYKGLGDNGGVADFVLGMLSLQMVIHRDRFPDEYASKSRTWVAEHVWDPVIQRVRQADDEIPDRYWVRINGKRDKKYRSMLLDIRQRLWDEGLYHHRMQHLLKKIRCKSDSSLSECSQDTEGGPVG